MNYWAHRRYYFTSYACFGIKRKIGRVYVYEPWSYITGIVQRSTTP